MSLFDTTSNTRVYRCHTNLSGCGWHGKKTDFVYAGRKSGKRVCPDCGKAVKRVYTEKQEWNGLTAEG